jgi:hypothetical protein
MTRWVLSAGLGLALGLGAALPAATADDPKPEEPAPRPTSSPALKAPDYSGYANVADVVGEVVRNTDKTLTFRVTWMVTQPSKSRPHLSANSRNFHNPYSSNRNAHPHLKAEHHDYQLDYVPESLIRFKHLPPKTDANGKKASYTEKEMDELKQPYSIPGYQASASDLTPGTIVEVHVIRDKTIPAAKATENDLRVKYVVILGHDPNPPKDLTSPSKNPPKKN